MLQPRTYRALRVLALLGFAAPTVGCFDYVAVSAAKAPAGRTVRAQLSERGFTRLSEAVGGSVPHLTRTIEGELVEANEQEIFVAVRSGPTGSMALGELHQRIAIPVADVLQLEVKQLNRGKTVAIAAGAVALVIGLVEAQIHTQTAPFPGPATP